MTIQQVEDFEATGNIGTAITTAQVVFTGLGGSPTVVAGLEGSKAGHFSGAGTVFQHFTTQFTPQAKVLFRARIRLGALPSETTTIWNAFDIDGSGTKFGEVCVAANGAFLLKNINTTVDTSTLTVTPGTDYSLEWLIDAVANTQSLRIYTDHAQTAAFAEQLDGPATAAANQVGFSRIGKITSAATITGGLTIDAWKRGDDWWAVESTEPLRAWDMDFENVAPGSNINTTNTPAIDNIAGANPVAWAGGPNTDQVAARYPQASDNRTMRALYQLADGGEFWERFYFSQETAPLGEGEALRIWRAHTTTPTERWNLVTFPGAGTTYELHLWNGAYQTINEDLEILPVGVIAGVPANAEVRIDIHTVGTQNGSIQIDAYWGNNLHAVANPNGSIYYEGTSSVNGRRRSLCSQTLVESAVHRAVHFDSWVGSAVAAPGPLPVDEQQVPATVSQWKFSEWDGAAEIPLAVTAWTGSAEEPIEIGETEIVGEGVYVPQTHSASAALPVAFDNQVDLSGELPVWAQARLTVGVARSAVASVTTVQPAGKYYSGSPGFGKVMLGWCSIGNWKYHHEALFSTHQAGCEGFRNVVPWSASGYGRAPNFAPACHRLFAADGFRWGDTPGGTLGDWGNHADGTWTHVRQAAANCDVVFISADPGTGSSGKTTTQRIYEGYYDTKIENTAAKMIDVYERYGAAIHWDLGNEPDKPDTGQPCLDLTWLGMLRRAARYLHFKFLEYGVPRNAFEVTGPMLMAWGAHQHNSRYQSWRDAGYPTTGSNSASNRADKFDCIPHWMPDWKGTVTAAGGYWGTNAFNPNPADFYHPSRPDEMDPWGYGRGPIMRTWHSNMYDQHWTACSTMNTMSISDFRLHEVDDERNGTGHVGCYGKFFRALYPNHYGGRGLATFAGEFSYPGKHNANGTWNVAETTHSSEARIAAAVKQNIVGISWWRQADPNDYNPNASGPYYAQSFGRTCNYDTGGNVADSDDGQRKRFVIMWHQSPVTGPVTTGTYGRSKPLSPQHN